MKGLAELWRHTQLSVSTLGLALVVAGLLAASFSLSRIAGWIPRSVLTVMLGLIVIQLGLEIRGRMRSARPAPAVRPAAGPAPPLPARSVTATVAVLWLAGALLALLLLGMTVGSALFAFAFLRRHAGESWRSSSLFALAFGAGLQLVFGVILQAQIYPGWLYSIIRTVATGA